MALLRVALLTACWACWACWAQGHITGLPFFPREMFSPTLFMATPELIKSHGYPGESHEVRTDDGYLLTIHRIPGTPHLAAGCRAHGTPVLVGHGLASNSEQWVVLNHTLAYFLADRGYDVWLANYRGSFYGRRHVTLSTKTRRFWDFSWHENGFYDLPAMIDLILAKTGRPKVLLLGHSLGSTVQAVTLAARPEYNNKTLAAVFMAPQIYFKHPEGFMELLRALAAVFPSLQEAFSTRVLNDQAPGFEIPIFFMCHPLTRRGRARAYCDFLVDYAGGQPYEPDDPNNFLQMIGHFPSSLSIRQGTHYFQAITSAEFQQYDFGAEKNREVYGTDRPPRYNLSNIVAPSYVYYSTTDSFVSQADSEEFAKELPTLKELYKIPHRYFSHGDYILAPASITLELYKHVVANMDKYI